MSIYAAKVGFWSSATDTSLQFFVGSGTFIGDTHILTAKHLFGEDGKTQLWARPAINAAAPLKVVLPPALHPTLDIAVAIVGSGLAHVGRVILDHRKMDSVISQGWALDAMFEGKSQNPEPVVMTSWDDAEKHYVTNVKQPKGYSGGAVCVGKNLWGVSTRHYVDPNTVRGCAIAVHQFAQWLAQWPDLFLDTSTPAGEFNAVSILTRRARGELRRPELKSFFNQLVSELGIDGIELAGDSNAEQLIEAIDKLSKGNVFYTVNRAMRALNQSNEASAAEAVTAASALYVRGLYQHLNEAAARALCPGERKSVLVVPHDDQAVAALLVGLLKGEPRSFNVQPQKQSAPEGLIDLSNFPLRPLATQDSLQEYLTELADKSRDPSDGMSGWTKSGYKRQVKEFHRYLRFLVRADCAYALDDEMCDKLYEKLGVPFLRMAPPPEPADIQAALGMSVEELHEFLEWFFHALNPPKATDLVDGLTAIAKQLHGTEQAELSVFIDRLRKGDVKRPEKALLESISSKAKSAAQAAETLGKAAGGLEKTVTMAGKAYDSLPGLWAGIRTVTQALLS